MIVQEKLLWAALDVASHWPWLYSYWNGICNSITTKHLKSTSPATPLLNSENMWSRLIAVQHVYLLVVCLRSSLSFWVSVRRCVWYHRPPSLLSIADLLPSTSLLPLFRLTRRLLEFSPVVLWQNLKPVFTFFYIDTDSNKCIFSPCNWWEHLWLRVCLCPQRVCIYLPCQWVGMKEPACSFFSVLIALFISSDSAVEIEMSYGATTGEEFKW